MCVCVITLVLSAVLVGPRSVHGCLSVQAVQVLSPAVRVEVTEELLHCVEGCYGLSNAAAVRGTAVTAGANTDTLSSWRRGGEGGGGVNSSEQGHKVFFSL